MEYHCNNCGLVQEIKDGDLCALCNEQVFTEVRDTILDKKADPEMAAKYPDMYEKKHSSPIYIKGKLHQGMYGGVFGGEEV